MSETVKIMSENILQKLKPLIWGGGVELFIMTIIVLALPVCPQAARPDTGPFVVHWAPLRVYEFPATEMVLLNRFVQVFIQPLHCVPPLTEHMFCDVVNSLYLYYDKNKGVNRA